MGVEWIIFSQQILEYRLAFDNVLTLCWVFVLT
jgi:hypothetical protein